MTRLGRTDGAARLLLDRLWAELDGDRLTDAERAARQLARLADAAAEEKGPGNGTAGNDELAAGAASTARRAVDTAQHPLGELPDLDELMTVGVSRIDHSRLVLLAAEIALADGKMTWLEDAASRLLELADELEDQSVAVRLRLAAAEVTGEWVGLVSHARKRAIPRDLAALVLARRARYLATSGDFADADAAWSEAVEQGLPGWPAHRRSGLALQPTSVGNALHNLRGGRVASNRRSVERSARPPARASLPRPARSVNVRLRLCSAAGCGRRRCGCATRL